MSHGIDDGVRARSLWSLFFGMSRSSPEDRGRKHCISLMMPTGITKGPPGGLGGAASAPAKPDPRRPLGAVSLARERRLLGAVES